MNESSAVTHGQYEDKTEEEAKHGESGLVSLWLEAINLASSEEEAWRDRATKTVEIFRDEKERSQRRYNILYANTQTLLPALYNSTPIPDVRPRFHSADPIAKVAARSLEKSLSYCIDEYDFDTELEDCVQDMALPGRGVMRVRYEPIVRDNVVAYQRVTAEHVPWMQFRRGPGRRWRDIPWIGFLHFLTRQQLRALNPEIADKINLDASISELASNKEAQPAKEVFQRACVWEIWDKENREILFIAPSYKEGFLKRAPDPLNLTGFFPVPRPLYAIETTDSLVPIDEYQTYKDQAEELDRITRRITALVMVCKWRGVYAATEESSGWLTMLKDADDGDLVPATDFMSIVVQGGGLDKAIWLMPIREIAEVLDRLYAQREQIKSIIFEITGTADIMRGSTKASETATAQQIKAQWGSLRVQKRQADIQRFCRDIFRMKAEIIAEKFSPEQIAMMTGEEVSPEIVDLLRQDVLRSYKIDIETDSTVRADLGRAQENMAQFVAGVAQFIAAIGPAVQAGQVPADVAAELFAAFARTFKLGKQAEDALSRMAEAAQQQMQQPKQPSPEEQAAQAKMQAEQQKAERDGQIAQAKAAADQQKTMQDLQTAQAKAQREEQAAQVKMMIDQAKAEAERAHKEALAAIELQTKKMLAEIQAEVAALKAQAVRDKADADREKIALAREKEADAIVAHQTKAAIDVESKAAMAEIAEQSAEKRAEKTFG